MFERFSTASREVVVQAQVHARDLAAHHIGTEHLLLALLTVDGTASRVLHAAGLTPALAREQLELETARLAAAGPDDEADARALDAIGIDLLAVRARLEQEFGPGAWDRARGRERGPRWTSWRRLWSDGSSSLGHLPFTRRSKTVLELALREAVHLRHRTIGTEHLLLGLLREGGGLGAAILAGRGLDVSELRRSVLARVADAA